MLSEANATGKLSDRHFERLLAEYDTEQTALESTMNEMREQIDTWSEDKLKTDKFIELVKRYTDFSELTTPMLNEFIEKLVVHEGDKRGHARRQRVDIHLNFIGTFEVPAEIVTPMEIEEQRRQEEEKAAREQLVKEREKERYTAKNEKAKQKAKEFAERKRAGLATAEELETEAQRLAKRAEYNKTYRETHTVNLPPKPPKPPTKQEIIRGIVQANKEGLPLTAEEAEIYAEYREQQNEKFRIYRAKIKANTPPKPEKLTTSEVLRKYKEGHDLTPEERKLYDDYREMRRDVSKRQYQKRKAAAALVEKPPKSPKMTITSIMNRRREGLPLNAEETAMYAEYREKKTEYQREWRNDNDGYYRDYKQKRKTTMAVAVGK